MTIRFFPELSLDTGQWPNNAHHATDSNSWNAYVCLLCVLSFAVFVYIHNFVSNYIQVVNKTRIAIFVCWKYRIHCTAKSICLTTIYPTNLKKYKKKFNEKYSNKLVLKNLNLNITVNKFLSYNLKISVEKNFLDKFQLIKM